MLMDRKKDLKLVSVLNSLKICIASVKLELINIFVLKDRLLVYYSQVVEILYVILYSVFICSERKIRDEFPYVSHTDASHELCWWVNQVYFGCCFTLALWNYLIRFFLQWKLEQVEKCTIITCTLNKILRTYLL